MSITCGEKRQKDISTFSTSQMNILFPNKKATIQNAMQFKIKMTFLLCHRGKEDESCKKQLLLFIKIG